MSAPRPTGDDVLKLVEEAAAVEREAAAKIADDKAAKLGQYSGSVYLFGVEVAEAIAAQIRARGAPMKEHGP